MKTRAYGNVSDRVGRPAETGIIVCIHPFERVGTSDCSELWGYLIQLIALRLYEGHLKLIQWQDEHDLKSFNVRFEDMSVTDVIFLENTGKNGICSETSLMSGNV